MKVYCDICGHEYFTYSEDNTYLICLQCGEPLEDIEDLQINYVDRTDLN